MKKLTVWAFIALFSILAVSCASSTGGGVVPLPPDLQSKITDGCDRAADFEQKADEFEAKYIEHRPTIIENREWIEELMPGVWSTLVGFDRDAAAINAQRKEIAAVVQIICRIFAGDARASADLDAKRTELQRQGVDWNLIITGALKLAPLFL